MATSEALPSSKLMSTWGHSAASSRMRRNWSSDTQYPDSSLSSVRS